MNGDGVRNFDEPYVPGWEIFIDLNDNQQLDGGEPVQTTDLNGEYWFMGLQPGSYIIAEVLQPGWEQTFPDPPGVHRISLSSGEIARERNFGNRRTGGSIHGNKWLDADGDGRHDVADVCGHGVPAALISIMLSAVAAESCRKGKSPKFIMDEVNDLLYEKLPEDKFISLIYAIYDADEQVLTYAVGGHPEGLVYRPRTDEIFKIKTEGSLVGVVPTDVAEFEEQRIQLEPGDRLLFYTDAVIEVLVDEDEAFGSERLESFFRENHALPIDEFINTLYDHVLSSTVRESINDDVTLIGMEILEKTTS